ncbi:hypothetical protein [Deinococcus aquatilis]|uniref:hypothetical protein n=1 Tax=Deinococcus aquatilis TaxID=519440 RepID=UPI00036E406A|nr:hypothetical protein [Deinococcus aquatilis]
MRKAAPTEHFVLARNHVVEAVQLPIPTNAFEDAVKSARNAYVRLTDAETMACHQDAREGTPRQQKRARELLVRNAMPLLLISARDFAWRFGGWLEALDAALHLLNLALPRTELLENGRIKRSGWNPHLNGARWLFWVEKTLAAELPKMAERLVDDKRASGAPAAIAAGRSRLLTTYGNDLGLHDEFQSAMSDWACSRFTTVLPKGRKNVTPKRGHGRYTVRFVQASGPGFFRDLTSAFALKTAYFTLRTNITASLVARAVRTNARVTLAKPGLAERTRQQAFALSEVTALWVERNSKSLRLDALVGEDQNERLQDIIAAPEPTQAPVFQAPLHQADRARALSAYRRYGAVYGPILLALPVRQLLPVYRQRVRDAQVRAYFRARCAQWGVPATQDVIACARTAAHLSGVSLSASAAELRTALAPVQAALSGGLHENRVSVLGSALANALQGQALAPRITDSEGIRVARELRQAYPSIAPRISLVTAILLGRKLDKTGKADQTFIAACVQADVRVKLADQAFALLRDVPVTTRKGQRVRVAGGSKYVRPDQLTLERHAVSAGSRADAARQTFLTLQAKLHVDSSPAQLQQVALAERVSDTLTAAAEQLEEAATRLTFGPALEALLAVDSVLDDHLALQDPGAWWAAAWWAKPLRNSVQVHKAQIYGAWAPVARCVLRTAVKGLPDMAVPF